MRDVVHVLKEHVLKEHASSSSTGTRPVFSTDWTQLHQQQQLLQKGLDSNKPCMHLG
jgi:aryl carrier-like protein